MKFFIMRFFAVMSCTVSAPMTPSLLVVEEEAVARLDACRLDDALEVGGLAAGECE
jgi:hypothetical protein